MHCIHLSLYLCINTSTIVNFRSWQAFIFPQCILCCHFMTDQIGHWNCKLLSRNNVDWINCIIEIQKLVTLHVKVQLQQCQISVACCNCNKVKYTVNLYSALSSEPLMRSGDHLSYGITQCYLPPGRDDSPNFTLAFTSTHFTVPRKVEGWVDLGRLHDIGWSSVFSALIVHFSKCSRNPVDEIARRVTEMGDVFCEKFVQVSVVWCWRFNWVSLSRLLGFYYCLYNCVIFITKYVILNLVIIAW